MDEREERVRLEKGKFHFGINYLIKELEDMELAEGIDQNSWLFAGCVQDLEKARTRIMDYIEKVLK